MVSQKKSRFVFLQETHSREESEEQGRNEWCGNIYHSHGSPNFCGVMGLIGNRLHCTSHKAIADPSGQGVSLLQRENFNCSLNPKLDKKGGVIVPRKMLIDSLECLQNKLDLVDIWTIKNPRTKSYTWSQRLPQIFSRLDYWLVSTNLQDFVISTDITPAIKTDHAASELA
ncbi:hypothetical protein pdam_00016410 [Pocillopora damicornis]|uniref:Endonuclease/exonuclease/phosphatase domain-containing protein n=1 Tax=Pocillopora damicornis TaxID=46731 RepID=A0A3M6TC57_POCDA|nr:hypothetical protein pdam_00016410 [Pocillopora damicornis]